MTGHEPVRSVAITMFPPALGQHVLLVPFQHPEPPDFDQIHGKPRFTESEWPSCCLRHHRGLPYRTYRALRMEVGLETAGRFWPLFLPATPDQLQFGSMGIEAAVWGRGWRCSGATPSGRSSCSHVSIIALASLAIRRAPWKGPGVMRRRSVPRGTVG